MEREFKKFHEPLWQADQYVEEDALFQPMMAGVPRIEVPMLIEGLLPRGYLVMLASAPKTGKTCIATAMAMAVATGAKFAGLKTRQSSVLWMAQEESHYERMQLLTGTRFWDPAIPFYTCHEYLPIDREETLVILANQINRTGAKLIVVDPLYASCTGRALDRAANARRTLQQLKLFCNEMNVTALVLHHAKDVNRPGRPPRVADSDQLAATAGMNIVLSFQSGTGGSVVPARNRKSSIVNRQSARLITLHMTGRGSFANQTLTLQSSGPLDYRMVATPNPKRVDEPAPLDAEEQRLVAILKGRPKHSGQILDRMPGCTEERLRSVLTRLTTKGVIRRVESKSWPPQYRLVERQYRPKRGVCKTAKSETEI